ncbi:MAG: ABC transporter permease, partial [Candidatus Binatia bacterium]
MFRLFVNVSLKELRLRPMRTALMLGGIAIGVSMVTAIDLLNRSVIEHFNASIMAAAGETELQVVAPGGERRIDADTAFAVAAVDGVYAALPVIDAGVPRSSSDEVIRVFATDFTDPRATSSYGVTIHGDLDPLELLNDPKAALVSERTARRLSLSRGAPLSLAAATGPREFRVAGILETRGPLGASGEDFLVMDIMAAQALLGIDGQVDRIDVVPETDQDLEALAATIRSRVDPALEVVTPYGRGRYFAEAVSAFQTMIFSLSLLALLTGVFIVYSAVSTSTVTRQRAIGTLRAVGVRPGEVVTLFAIEAAACGLLASLVGSLLGALLARVLADQATGTIGVIFQLRA